jgi:hypothetical protein
LITFFFFLGLALGLSLPACVSFSSSNQCGNADKSLGINLIEVFLRIVAVKKHQKNSQLKAWFMENVANSNLYFIIWIDYWFLALLRIWKMAKYAVD